MAWTQADADAVRAAVLALATGTRTVTVSYSGPPSRSETYGVAQLGELRALLTEVERQAAGAPTFRRTSFSKGFGCG